MNTSEYLGTKAGLDLWKRTFDGKEIFQAEGYCPESRYSKAHFRAETLAKLERAIEQGM